MNLRSALTIASCLSIALDAEGGVVRNVNNPLSGGSSLQLAIDAAQDGDLLLLEGTGFGTAVIDGKSLSIVAMSTGPKQVNRIVIKNLAPNQFVFLHGLETFHADYPGLELVDNEGLVLVQVCTLKGGWAALPAHAGLRAINSNRVVLSQCSVLGSDQPYGVVSGGGHGVLAVTSSIGIFDCTLRGGRGSQNSCSGGPGGQGLQLEGSMASVVGSTLVGGGGGSGNVSVCCLGGPGGDGTQLVNSSALLLDDILSFGLGGPNG